MAGPKQKYFGSLNLDGIKKAVLESTIESW